MECGFAEAIIVMDGRAYVFAASGPDHSDVDLDTFRAMPSTETLDPAHGDDSPVAGPSQAPLSAVAPSPA